MVNGFTEVEDESFGCSVCRHVGNRLKAGVRGNFDATPTSGGHCFAEEMSKSDQCLYIHLDFRLLPLGVMREKWAVQTESNIIDEKIHLNTAPLKLFRDCLWAAWISQVNAENGTLNPIFRVEARRQDV